MISYVRVCNEFSIESDFPSYFMVQSEQEEDFVVTVEYSWILPKCLACKTFGHDSNKLAQKFGKPLAVDPTAGQGILRGK